MTDATAVKSVRLLPDGAWLDMDGGEVSVGYAQHAVQQARSQAVDDCIKVVRAEIAALQTFYQNSISGAAKVQLARLEAVASRLEALKVSTDKETR